MASMELIKTILKDSANLKAYYRFESGALTTDSSGNGYTLTNTNTCTEVTGKFGGGASTGTSNTNKRFSIADNLGIAGNGDMSVSFWVNINTDLGSGVYYTLFSHRSTTTADRSLDIMYMKDPTKNVYIGNSGVTISTAIDLGTGTWHHIVATRISGISTLYIDGAFKASGNQGSTTYSTNQVLIGGDTGSYASIQVDDVAVFNSALSADQIKELYEGRILGELRPQTGLVGLYHLNGSSTDFSGNNNHGTDTAITYSQANGKFGQGAGFNGSSSLIDCGTGSSLNLTGEFTICARIKVSTSTAIKYNVICGKSKYGSHFEQYVLYENNGQICLRIRNDADSVYEATKASVGIDVWQSIVAVFSDNKLKVYVNESPGSETSFSGNRGLVSDSFKIGGIYMSNNVGYFHGAIDEVAVFNVAKSASWVRQQYSLGRFGEI